jgi:putative acetyltransferase
MTRIRLATNLDLEDIREVYLRAFSESERKIGTKLIENGIEQLSEKGVSVVFVYGDPKYYGKFGFNAGAASRYSPPYELQYPFGWQAIALNEVCFEKQNVKISCVASLCDPELW